MVNDSEGMKDTQTYEKKQAGGEAVTTRDFNEPAISKKSIQDNVSEFEAADLVGNHVIYEESRGGEQTGRVIREVSKGMYEIAKGLTRTLVRTEDIHKIVEPTSRVKLFGIFEDGGSVSPKIDENSILEEMLAMKGLDKKEYSTEDLKSLNDYIYPYKIQEYLANKVWGMVKKHGFKQFKSAKISVFNVGNGELLRYIPDTVSKVDAVEQDVNLYMISKLKYENEKIKVHKDSSVLSGTYDLNVGVCNGLITIVNPDFVDNLKSGGLMVGVICHKLFEEDTDLAKNAREILNEKFDLLEAYNLPSDVMDGFDLVALKKL